MENTLTKTQLEHYLTKIGLDYIDPDLDSLNRLIWAHITNFPFSSVNVLLQKELPLDTPSLFNRLIENNEGGYCFEHNKLFYEVLNYLGFKTSISLAKVTITGNFHNGRTHRLTIVDIDNHKYLVDVGFGAMGPTSAIPINDKVFSKTIDSIFEVKQIESQFHLINKSENIVTLYVFDYAKYNTKDCEVAHFYSHKSPKAIFVNHLIVSLMTKNGAIQITNDTVTTNYKKQIKIKNARILRQFLKEEYNFNLSVDESDLLFSKVRKACFKDTETSLAATSIYN